MNKYSLNHGRSILFPTLIESEQSLELKFHRKKLEKDQNLRIGISFSVCAYDSIGLLSVDPVTPHNRPTSDELGLIHCQCGRPSSHEFSN